MPKRTPLYNWHVAHGARMVDFAGWDMPVQYTSIVEEHQAVRTAAGLFDISHMGRLILDGSDALNLIQHVYTNDAVSMKLGQVRYGLICNEQGGALDDVLVYRFEPYWLMVVNASNREKILPWLQLHRATRKVRIVDETMPRAMVAVQGPRAFEMLRECDRLPLKQCYEMGKSLKYYHAAVLRFAGRGEVVISRTGYTGEDGFEIIFDDALAKRIADDLVRAAASSGVDLRPCGLGARDTLRLEAAMPLYGHELTEDIDPFQAGLGWAVKMDKGDFIGREALARRRQDKSLRQRVGLEVDGKRIAREGCAVLRDGREIGRVTSGTFAPTLNKAIAMAYVEPAHTATGTTCEVAVRGKTAPARVVPLPFYRRGTS